MEIYIEAYLSGLTVTRTFSVRKDLLTSLEKEAKSKGISTSALMNQELQRCERLVWPSERTGALVVARDIIKAFIESMTAEEAHRIGSASILQHKTSVRFLLTSNENLNGVLNLIEFNYGNYARWFNFDHTLIGKDHRILLTHTLGVNWSSFLEGYFISFFDEMLGLRIQSQYTETTVIIEFRT